MRIVLQINDSFWRLSQFTIKRIKIKTNEPNTFKKDSAPFHSISLFVLFRFCWRRHVAATAVENVE